MLRILIFGAAWVVILTVMLFAVWNPQPAPIAAVDTSIGPSPPSPPAPPPRAGTRFPGWTVTRSYSAHHMMIVEVEAAVPQHARQIAAQLVEPLEGRYDEVLVYVRDPGASLDELAGRRVQWTKRSGYVEIIFSPEK
jgi:hypothetical protein